MERQGEDPAGDGLRTTSGMGAPAPGRRGDVWRLLGAAAFLLGLVLMAPAACIMAARGR